MLKSRSRSLAAIAGSILSLALSGCGGGDGHSTALPLQDKSSSPQITIAPATFSLNEGDSVAFQVRSGTLLVPAPDLRWQVDPSFAGTVAANGTFRAASQFKDVKVIAIRGSSSATAFGSVKAVPATIQKVGTVPQAASVGRPLTDSLAVQVMSESGKAVEGVPISFAVLSGAGAVEPPTRFSGPDGIARASWRLGPEPGPQSVKASSGTLGELTFSVEAVPDYSSVKASAIEGAGQTAAAGELLPLPLTVAVSDSLGNAIAGVQVQWVFSAGTAFENGGNPAQASDTLLLVTGAQGRSSVRWRVGTVAGFQQASAYVARASTSSGSGTSTSSSLPGVFYGAQVTPGPAATLNLSPKAATLEIGSTRAFAVDPRDAYGNPVAGLTMAWSSSAPSVASVDAAGLVTTHAGGTATLTVSSAGLVETAPILVASAVRNLTVADGNQQSGTVGRPLANPLRVRLLTGSGAPVAGELVTWTVTAGGGSVAPATSTTDGQGFAGAFLTLGPLTGTHQARASVSGVTPVGFSATGTAGPLDTIVVTPDSTAVAVDSTRQFTAQARDAYGNLIPGAIFSWTSTTTGVATVDGNGLARGIAQGSTTIRASAGGSTGSAKLTVVAGSAPPPPPPPPPSLPGTVADLQVVSSTETTVTLRWTQVDDGTGNPAKYALRWGSPTIDWTAAAATQVSVTGTAIGAPLEYTFTGLQGGRTYAFMLQPYRGTLGAGATLGSLSNIATGTTPVVQLTLTSGNNQTGTVGSNLAQPIRVRVATTAGVGISGRAVTWSITAGGGSLAQASSVTDAQGYAQNTWTLGTHPVANGARAAATGLGSIDFAASAVPGPVARVNVTPDSAAVQTGSAQQFSATAQDQFGNPVPGASLLWTSTAPSIATVSGSGLATGLSGGRTFIRAASGTTAADSSALVVSAAPPPPPPPAAPSQVTTLQAVGSTETTVTLRWTEVSDGTGAPAKYALRYGTPTINWGAASPTEVTVLGTTIGATRQYTFAGLTQNTGYQFQLVSYRGTLGVDPVFGPLSNVASGTTGTGGTSQAAAVTLTPASLSFTSLNATQQLTALATDGTGATVSNPGFTWQSTNTSVATVNTTGLVTARAVGAASIVVSAACCGSDTSSVSVSQTVASVSVTPTSPSGLVPGQTLQFTATVRDANGFAINGATVTWASTDSTVARINASGLATAVAAGSTTIRATSSGVAGTASLAVSPPSPPAGQAPFFSDGFESGNLSHTENGARWGTGISTAVSSQVAHSGGRSLRFQFAGNASLSADAQAEQPFLWGRRVGRIWVEFWAYYPNGSDGLGAKYVHRDGWGPDDNGFLGIWAGSGTNPASVSTTPTSTGGSGLVHPGGTFPYYISNSELGRWIQVRVHARMASSGSVADGVLDVWRDGALAFHATGLPLWSSTTPYWDAGRLLGWANSGFTETTNVFIDDVKFYDSDPSWALSPVIPIPTSIVVSPTSVSLTTGGTQALTATVRDQFGAVMSGQTVTWSSQLTSVASVSSSGVVTGVGAGSTTVTARVLDVSRSVAVTVTSPLPPSGNEEPRPGANSVLLVNDNFDSYADWTDARRTGAYAVSTLTNEIASLVSPGSGGSGKSIRLVWPVSTIEQYAPISKTVSGWPVARTAEYFSIEYRAPGFVYSYEVDLGSPRLGKKHFLIFPADNQERVTNSHSNDLGIGVSLLQSNGVKIGDGDEYDWDYPGGSLAATIATITDGNWHRYTYRRLPESQPGAMDGSFTVWFDGQLVWHMDRIGTGTAKAGSIAMASTFNGGSSRIQSEYFDNLRIWYER